MEKKGIKGFKQALKLYTNDTGRVFTFCPNCNEPDVLEKNKVYTCENCGKNIKYNINTEKTEIKIYRLEKLKKLKKIMK